jgi:methionyl aminopeptidase
VVHGIPGLRILEKGQLVTLDVAAEVNGYHADAAVTVPVGAVDPRARRLVSATRAALAAGMRAAQPGATLRDVGAAVERTTQARGYTHQGRAQIVLHAAVWAEGVVTVWVSHGTLGLNG